jgi:hypothetical protein
MALTRAGPQGSRLPGIAAVIASSAAVPALRAPPSAYGNHMVTLAEDLYLLADDAVTGRPVIDQSHLALGLAGSLLLDLALRRRVVLVEAHVTVASEARTGEPLLDGALARIAGEGRAHGPDHWVRQLARGARHTVQDRLIEVGVLQRDARKFLRVIPVHRTHETDGRLHHELVEQLHDAVVLNHTPSPETAALALLALAVGLEQHLFPRVDHRVIGRRMAEVAAGCGGCAWVGTAVSCAVNARDAALGITPTSGAIP